MRAHSEYFYHALAPRGGGTCPSAFHFGVGCSMLCKCRHYDSHNASFIQSRKCPQLISNAAAAGHNITITINSLRHYRYVRQSDDSVQQQLPPCHQCV